MIDINVSFENEWNESDLGKADIKPRALAEAFKEVALNFYKAGYKRGIYNLEYEIGAIQGFNSPTTHH